MPQFLLELFSEEIPARMQAGAARDLERLSREALSAEGLSFDGLTAFAGPRRLTLVVEGLPVAQADRIEERKGPKASAPAQAVEGFLRSTGLSREDLVERDGVLFAVVSKQGRPTAEILGGLIESLIARFPWPKSMIWGNGGLRWVRPLHGVLAVFNGQIVPAAAGDVVSSDRSEGHRFMGPRTPFQAHDYASYRAGLAERYVVLDVAERRQRVLDGARALCAAEGLELVEDIGLLEEVSGMAEWPKPLMGRMDPRFLDLPPEVVRTSMRTHQRYFAVREPGAARLAPRFICVANIEAPDGGAVIALGAARVLSARLEDARFFWEEDRKAPLESRLKTLEGVTFHAKLGTMRQRVARIEALARALAPMLGVEAEAAARAALLCKADLATGMVGEFPELQGVMGGYYAEAQGETAQIAAAVRDHYRPQGPSDATPTAPLSIVIALADKLDMLHGFFSIGQAPTGTRDPFALRRAALGVIRIIQENGLRLPLRALLSAAAGGGEPPEGLLNFFFDRLEVALRDQGHAHDKVAAVLSQGDDDLVRLTSRLKAVEAFLATDDGANLLAGFRRAANILASEGKKGGLPAGDPARPADPAEEVALFDALSTTSATLGETLDSEAFSKACELLAGLRAPLDAFFEAVLVNAPDPALRANRLRLLTKIRDSMLRVADFGKISG